MTETMPGPSGRVRISQLSVGMVWKKQSQILLLSLLSFRTRLESEEGE